MPASIIKRINQDHASNRAQAAKRIVPTGNRLIDRINRDHAVAQRSGK